MGSIVDYEHVLIQLDHPANKLQAAVFVSTFHSGDTDIYHVSGFWQGPHDPKADILLVEESPQAQDGIV